MTLKDVLNGGFPEEPNHVEDLPDEALAIEVDEPSEAELMAVAPVEPRHLAIAGETETLCGIDRTNLKTIHPSKAKKTDCPLCRAENNRKKNKVKLAAIVTTAIEDRKLALPVPIPTPQPEPTPEPELTEPTIVTPPPPKPRAYGSKWKPTHEEVSKVRALRAAKFTLEAIDIEMGWPPSHGNRPWKILKGKTVPA